MLVARSLLLPRKFQRVGKFILLGVVLSFSIGFCVFKYFERSVCTSQNVHGRNVNTENVSLPSKYVEGALNIRIWRGLCGSQLTNLRQSLFFPRYPDERSLKFINEFHIDDNAIHYGQQIVGFVRPAYSGFFRFAIASDDESELWLSRSGDPNEKHLIARVLKQGQTAWTQINKRNKYPDQISEDLKLRKDNKYYIEVLHKQGVGNGFVQVFWKSFTDADFKMISSNYLASYIDKVIFSSRKDVLHNVFSGRYLYDMQLKLKRTTRQYLQFYSLPVIPEDNYLPSCDYKTSFVLNGSVKGDQGRTMVNNSISSVFPADDTSMGAAENSCPNQAADRDTIQAVVNKIITSLWLNTSK